jgi:hypothetical protein
MLAFFQDTTNCWHIASLGIQDTRYLAPETETAIDHLFLVLDCTSRGLFLHNSCTVVSCYQVTRTSFLKNCSNKGYGSGLKSIQIRILIHHFSSIRIRVRIRSHKVIESGSNADPDPQQNFGRQIFKVLTVYIKTKKL